MFCGLFDTTSQTLYNVSHELIFQAYGKETTAIYVWFMRIFGRAINTYLPIPSKQNGGGRVVGPGRGGALQIAPHAFTGEFQMPQILAQLERNKSEGQAKSPSLFGTQKGFQLIWVGTPKEILEPPRCDRMPTDP